MYIVEEVFLATHEFICVCVCVSLQQLRALIDRKTGKRLPQKPRFVKQDQVVLAVLETSGIICLETFKEFPQMARFTLRDEGQNIVLGQYIMSSKSCGITRLADNTLILMRSLVRV